MGFYRIANGLGTGTYTLQAHYYLNDCYNTTIVNVTAGSETTNVNLQINDTVPPAPPSGNITGRVTDIAGNPIVSAPVYASTFYAAWVAEGMTDAAGNYIISGLINGIYNVIVQGINGSDGCPHYLPQTKSNISVTENQETSNIDFQLTPIVSGRISGIIQTTETPAPIPEFTVELYIFAIFVTVSTIVVLKKFRSSYLIQERRCKNGQESLTNQ